MGQPIAVTDGIAFAFPNICKTPTPAGSVPIPYPSIAQLSDATDASSDVKAGGKGIILKGKTEVPTTSGDEAGTADPHGLKCEFTAGSGSVKVNGKEVVRMGDATKQNNGNASGFVLGGLATVLVGG